MVGFCIFGAGRMGQLHARTLLENDKATLQYVYDVIPEAAKELAERYGARVAPDVQTALASEDVDAVIITTPAGSHVELVIEAARAGKAIFTEKPLSEDIQTAKLAIQEIRQAGVITAMGFMKRFEPSHYKLIQAVKSNQIGRVELVVLTNRDIHVTILELARETHKSAPYTLLRESTVHDFDLARVLLGEEPVEVYVAGSCLVEPEFETMGEIDAAMTTLRTGSGQMCHINNIWRTQYGYDQRIEVFGSKGMLRAENRPETSVMHFREDGILLDRLIPSSEEAWASDDFFMPKYAAAYPHEMNLFVEAVISGEPPLVTIYDGYRAQLIVEAAVQSLSTNQPVKIDKE